MVEFIVGWLINNAVASAAGVSLAAVLTWLLYKIPTDGVRKAVYMFAKGIGAAISGFFNRWKWTSHVWDKSIEPWLIGFLDMLFGAFLQGLFDGLRFDNPPEGD